MVKSGGAERAEEGAELFSRDNSHVLWGEGCLGDQRRELGRGWSCGGLISMWENERCKWSETGL